MNRAKGIYCIENWSANPRCKLSVRPMLEILYRAAGVKYIHHHCDSKAEFMECLRRFSFSRYKNYFLHIAAHGEPGLIRIGHEPVTLSEIGDVLGGVLTNRGAFMGSCSVMRTKRVVIDDFLTKTGANFVAGYRRRVDFVESTAEELSFLYQITRSPKALTKSNLAENFKLIVSIEK